MTEQSTKLKLYVAYWKKATGAKFIFSNNTFPASWEQGSLVCFVSVMVGQCLYSFLPDSAFSLCSSLRRRHAFLCRLQMSISLHCEIVNAKTKSFGLFLCISKLIYIWTITINNILKWIKINQFLYKNVSVLCACVKLYTAYAYHAQKRCSRLGYLIV